MSILVGEHRIDDYESNHYNVEKIIIDPKYNTSTTMNDYAILTLTESLSFSETVSPACLPSDPEEQYVGKY